MQLRCAPVTQYLGLARKGFIAQVQPWMLASHTAAFPFNIKNAPAQNLYAGQPPSQDLIDWWTSFTPADDKLLGCSYEYSDLGVLSLGFATVQAAGSNFSDLMTSVITRPWAMIQTFLDMNDAGADVRVTGYQNGKATQWTLGVKSSTADLLNFLLAHLGVVESSAQMQAAVDLVLTPLNWQKPGAGMGICWQIHKTNGVTMFTKDGGGDGFSTWVALVPEQQVALAFLANSNPKKVHWGKLSDELLASLLAG